MNAILSHILALVIGVVLGQGLTLAVLVNERRKDRRKIGG